VTAGVAPAPRPGLAADTLPGLFADASSCAEAEAAGGGGGVGADRRESLEAFRQAHGFDGKGALCVALIVTRHAARLGLPLDPELLLAPSGGQVLGLGRGAVQAILADHGVARVLAHEGGRTSRGSIDRMRRYAAFLNALAAKGPVDLAAVEAFWIERVHDLLAAEPFRLRLDPARGLRALVGDLLDQAAERQRDNPGMQWQGAVLQHFVGATLDLFHEPGGVAHHGFSTADAPSGRVGDFLVGDVAVHVTTAPGEAVIGRCRANVEAGLRAVLVTLDRRAAGAEMLAENAGLLGRIDVLGVEQFVAAALLHRDGFSPEARRATLAALVARYNAIVGACETDRGLAIDLDP
jgi:hypothetical protein